MSRVRAPQVPATKIMACRDCGEPIVVNVQKQHPPRCLECGIKAQLDAVRQMRAKEGPVYQRWLQGRGYMGRPRSRGTGLDKLSLIFPGQGRLPAEFSWYG